jgi:tight adherence protein B
MGQLAAYGAVFALTFALTALAAAAAWALTGRGSTRKRPPAAQQESPGILRSEVLSTITLLAPVLEKIRLVGHLRQLLAEADVTWSVGRTVLLSLTLGMAGFYALLLTGALPLALSLAGALALASVPTLVIRSRRAQRFRAVEQQLPEALDYLSRALLAGHSLPMSLELLAEECDPPLSAELRKTIDEYNLGASLEGALRNLTVRLPSVDILFFVTAIQTQSRTGGSLNDLLENLAETIRERITLKQQVRALTANGRMTAVVLSVLPFAVAGTMMYINPDYFDLLLSHPFGPAALIVAVCAQIAAYLVIRRIVDIRV